MNINSFTEKNKAMISALIVLFNIFLIVLVASTFVDVQNKVKEGRYIGQEIESKNKITVSSQGEVYVKPDLALTTLSVVTESEKLQDAMEENTEKMNEVISFVKGKGVEEKDLKTTTFSISPRYEWHKEEGSSSYSRGTRILVGYEVKQSLQVKMRDMEIIGEILEGSSEKGANEVGSLQFTVENEDKAREEAREKAIEKAKEKAQGIASQLGVKLIRITNFDENIYFPMYDIERPMAESEGSSSPQIETGENKITANVSLTYEID
jgi:uncharacterized protein